MENILVENKELSEEALVAFVDNEDDLRDVLISEADGLIVLTRLIEIKKNEPLVLHQGQKLVGQKCLNDELCGLNFVGQHSQSLINLADDCGFYNLSINVNQGALRTNEAFVGEACRDVVFSDVVIEAELKDNSSLFALRDECSIDFLNGFSLNLNAKKSFVFCVENDSRLNFRGSSCLRAEGENTGILLRFGATVNLFSGAELALCCDTGCVCEDAALNIFGGASVIFENKVFMKNEFETMQGIFVYKDALFFIKRRKKLKCCCFKNWRDRVVFSGLRDFGDVFEPLSKTAQRIQETLKDK